MCTTKVSSSRDHSVTLHAPSLSCRWNVATLFCGRNTSIQRPYCTVHMYVVIHVCDKMGSILSRSKCVSVLHRLCQCGWRVEITLTNLTPSHFSACLKPIFGYPTSQSLVFCLYSVSWGEKRLFCSNWRIADHHLLFVYIL